MDEDSEDNLDDEDIADLEEDLYYDDGGEDEPLEVFDFYNAEDFTRATPDTAEPVQETYSVKLRADNREEKGKYIWVYNGDYYLTLVEGSETAIQTTTQGSRAENAMTVWNIIDNDDPSREWNGIFDLESGMVWWEDELAPIEIELLPSSSSDESDVDEPVDYVWSISVPNAEEQTREYTVRYQIFEMEDDADPVAEDSFHLKIWGTDSGYTQSMTTLLGSVYDEKILNLPLNASEEVSFETDVRFADWDGGYWKIIDRDTDESWYINSDGAVTDGDAETVPVRIEAVDDANRAPAKGEEEPILRTFRITGLRNGSYKVRYRIRLWNQKDVDEDADYEVGRKSVSDPFILNIEENVSDKSVSIDMQKWTDKETGEHHPKSISLTRRAESDGNWADFLVKTTNAGAEEITWRVEGANGSSWELSNEIAPIAIIEKGRVGENPVYEVRVEEDANPGTYDVFCQIKDEGNVVTQDFFQVNVLEDSYDPRVVLNENNPSPIVIKTGEPKSVTFESFVRWDDNGGAALSIEGMVDGKKQKWNYAPTGEKDENGESIYGWSNADGLPAPFDVEEVNKQAMKPSNEEDGITPFARSFRFIGKTPGTYEGRFRIRLHNQKEFEDGKLEQKVTKVKFTVVIEEISDKSVSIDMQKWTDKETGEHHPKSISLTRRAESDGNWADFLVKTTNAGAEEITWRVEGANGSSWELSNEIAPIAIIEKGRVGENPVYEVRVEENANPGTYDVFCQIKDGENVVTQDYFQVNVLEDSYDPRVVLGENNPSPITIKTGETKPVAFESFVRWDDNGGAALSVEGMVDGSKQKWNYGPTGEKDENGESIYGWSNADGLDVPAPFDVEEVNKQAMKPSNEEDGITPFARSFRFIGKTPGTYEGRFGIRLHNQKEFEDGKLEQKVTKVKFTVVIEEAQSPDTTPDKPSRPSHGGGSGGGSGSGGGGGTSSSKKATSTSTGVTTSDSKKGYVNSLTGIKTGSNNTVTAGYSNWQQEADGSWKLRYADGSMAAGTKKTATDGSVYEQVHWEMINGAWYAFGADGVADQGMIYDTELAAWFYVDINTGMKTGWHQIDGKWYYFHDISDGSRGRMLRSTRTPDGYWVDDQGVWDTKGKA